MDQMDQMDTMDTMDTMAMLLNCRPDWSKVS